MPYRLFVDEVGTDSMVNAGSDANERFLSLTGLMCNVESHENSIQHELDRTKYDVFALPPEQVILHRREIVRREGVFSVLREFDKDKLFKRRLLGIIRSSPMLVFSVTIDKKEHLEKYSVWHYNPYHYCLRALIERYFLWLNRNDQIGDVAIEPRYKKVDKKLKASFRKIYENGTEHIPPEKMQKRLTSHDIKFIEKSKNVAGMQICDLIAHPSYRAMRREREGLHELNDFGYEIVSVLRERRYARHPKTLVIQGVGLKWLP